MSSAPLSNDPIHCQAPAIVLACGGDGKRMGGGKPLRELAGVPLARRMAEWAGRQSDCVAVAVRGPDQIPDLGLPRVMDGHRDIGPISALASAFEFARSADREWVFMTGCDQPFLPTDLVDRLARAIGDAGAAMPVYRRQDQPMAALWRTQPVALHDYIAGGGRSLWRFADRVGAVRVEWQAVPESDPFLDINDTKALAVAEMRLKRRER